MPQGLPETHDGVGMVCRDNVAIVVYAADARLHRTRWLFDRIDALAARNSGGIFCLMVVEPSAGPPDAPTRKENAARFRRIDPVLKAMVTVALGDEFRLSIVRAVMRAMILISGQAGRHLIAVTEHEGIDKLLERIGAGPALPSRVQLESDLAAVRAKVSTRAA